MWVLLVLVFVCTTSIFFHQLNWVESYQFVTDYVFTGNHEDNDISAFGNVYLLVFLIFNIIILVNFVISVLNAEFNEG